MVSSYNEARRPIGSEMSDEETLRGHACVCEKDEDDREGREKTKETSQRKLFIVIVTEF